MAADGSVIIEIDGDDSKFKKNLADLKSITGTALRGIATATAATAAALVGLSGAAVAVGKDFETSLAGTSTMFGTVAVDMQGLTDQILDMSGKTGIAATQISDSLYNALSAGIPVTEDMTGAMDFMEQSAKLAAAGFTDIDTAVTATAKVMNTYGMGLDSVDKIQKIMLQTQNKGITTVDELGATLAQVTPTAAAMGVSFENVGAGLATMTAQGTPTAQATTQLNTLFAELGKQGTTAANNLQKAAAGTQYAGLGFADMMNAGVPLNEVLDLMADYAEKNGLSMIDMFGSIEAGKAALSMAGENSEAFAANLAAMGTSADLVGDAYAKVTDTLEHKLSVLRESVKNLGIAAYEGMKEPLGAAAQAASDGMAEVAAAFESGGLSGAVEAAGRVLGEMTAEVAGAAPKLVDAAFDLMGAFAKGIWAQRGKIAKAAQDVATTVFDAFGDAVPFLKPVTNALSGLTKNLKDIIPIAGATAAAVLAFKGFVIVSGTVNKVAAAFQTAKLQIALYAAANGQAAIATAAANGTFKATEIITALMTKQITIAQAASIGLKAAMTALSGPIGIAVMAVAALGGGLLAYKMVGGGASEASVEMARRAKELSASLEEQKQVQDELAARRGENISDVQLEIDSVRDYVTELRTLTDANGAVKQGYEDRAAYLTEQINNLVPNAVAVNQTERGSIYEINSAIEEQIFLREKEMTLEAMRESYIEAKKNLVQAEQDVTEALRQQAEKAEQMAAVQQKLNDATSQTSQDRYAAELHRLGVEYEELGGKVDEARGTVEGYYSSLNAYDTVSAVQSQEELKQATIDLSTQILKSTGENDAALKLEAANKKEHYDRMKADFEANAATMTDAERREREKQLEIAKESYESQVTEAEKAGVTLVTGAEQTGGDTSLGLAKGALSKLNEVANAGIAVAMSMLTAIKDTAGVASPAKETIKIGEFIDEGLAVGMKNGQGQVIKTAEDLSKAVLEAATEWVDDKKFYNQLAAKEELSFWEGLLDNSALQAEELAKVERKAYKARADASKEAFEHSRKWIEQEKFYKRLSAEEEVAAWERVAQRKKLAANEQLEAEKNLYSAQGRLLEEQKKKVEDYEKNLAARAESLRSFAGLFDEVDVKTERSGQELLKNMQGQVALFQGWQADLEKLAENGASDALLAELRELGPKAAADIRALATLSKKEMAECVAAFDQLGSLAQVQAEKEMADAALELPVEMAVLSKAQASKAVAGSVTAIAEAVAANTERLKESAGSVADGMCQVILDKRSAFFGVGIEAMRGLDQGLRIQGQVAISTARRIADSIIFEMQRALDIHSPSRKMRDLVGKPAAQGLFVGFEEEMGRFGRMAQAAVERETGRISAGISAQADGRPFGGVTREVHSSEKIVEKVARLEGDGLTGELIRMMNVKIQEEQRRLGPSFA